MRAKGIGAVLAAVALSVSFGVAPADAAPETILGFTPKHSAAQRAAEQTFSGVLSPAVARELDRDLAHETGLVSTPGDYKRMRKVVDYLRSYGLQPQVHTYYVYQSVPRRIEVTMTSPRRITLPTKEPCLAVETDCANMVVGYNALSPSGDVTAPVVYANYATPADFAELDKRGISVEGKVVLARYGANFRGVKSKLAAAHGAKAVIIYSDPKDDGNTNGAVYPGGPWRNPDGIQRGSVQQLMQYGGDPLTPGWASTKDAPRIDPKDSNIAPIPTTPISYAAAEPLLKALGGPQVPANFQGGLPFPYHFGPGPTTVRVNLDIAYETKPLWDVTATVPGRSQPDQTVYVGAHRDSWTYGSDDNLSGTEAVLQIGRGIGALLKTGWRPERSITLATWDGEEYGLFGSTEYAEQMGDRLKGAVTYLNMDGAGGKHFGAAGTPSLDRTIRQVTKDVPWPGTKGSAYDAWVADHGGKVPPISRLGSGSDYTAFFDRFGVPSANIGSSTDSGNYHCSCDNFWMEDHYIDPTWQYHVATAQTVGLTTLRLANADVLPMYYSDYAAETGDYLTAFGKQQSTVDVSGLKERAAQWQRAAKAAEDRVANRLATGGDGPIEGIRNSIASRLFSATERQLLTDAGLPGRPWYRHQVYAPGINAGYGTQVLPGLHDAVLERHNPAEAATAADSFDASLRKATAVVSAAGW
ncbi:M28 family peptidase [Amycolatopsis sp. CA-230715]|uniref:M28 family peptidase n=1 Tax=Amycolatopsis sp. CA-230715 TaxID=2745196 RepID=UPI001C013216|nr:M28 family peptidase [Amycolatopsis sp. CA-230715]QWF76672.1 hypothetical protein HUW46_00048 [Amycolatopsis sp. CA-230715]